MTAMHMTLGDLCELKYGKSLPAAQREHGSATVYGSNGPVGTHSEGLLTGPAIVVGRKGSYGEVHYSSGELWPIDTTYFIDESATNCDLRWLYHLLKHLPLTTLNKSAAIPGLSREDAYRLRVTKPALDEQRRIAAILDKADTLRSKRKRALELLDGLTQSIFVEMFGDPAKNPKNWPRIVLGDCIHKASDGPHVSPQYSETGVPFLSTRHVQPGQIVWEDLKYIDLAQAEIHWKKCRPERGDILYTKGGTTGLAALIDSDAPFAVWVHIALLKTDKKVVDPVWLESMLNSEFCYRQSQMYTHGIANRDLGLKRMVKIDMYLPPKSEQERFVRASMKVRKLRATLARVGAEDEQLFSSLQHRAFTGQL